MKKIKDYSFRELERKFVKIYNIESLLKNMGINDIKDYSYAFAYIDVECGFTFRILGNESTGLKYIDDKYILVRRGAGITELNAEIIDNKEYEYAEKVLETSSVYYENKDDILSVRNLTEIDNLRFENFPDDLQIIIQLENGELEVMWARSISYIKENEVIIVRLLDSSYYDKNYKEGDVVAVKYIPDADKLVVVGKVQTK